MKRNKILFAKFAIGVILLITCALGVAKLIHYLGKPMTLFYSSVETIFNELEYAGVNISNNKLYQIIANNKVRLNGDITLNVTGLENINSNLQSRLNSAKYNTILEFDRENKYLKNTLKVNSGNLEVFEHIYIENDFLKTIRATDEELYQKIESDKINLEFLNFSINNTINDIIKSRLSNTLLEENFKTRSQAINVNNQSVDCNVNFYEMSGAELSTLIEFIFSEIKLKSDATYYIADLFGIKGSEVSSMLASIKNSLNIDTSKTYVFESYTRVNTDETLRFTITEKNINGESKELFVINRSKGNITVDINKKDKLRLGITGYDSNTQSFWFETAQKKYTLVMDKISNKGRILVTDINSQKEILTAEYSYIFNENNNNIVSISLEANYIKNFDNSPSNIHIAGSLLLTSGVQINQVKVGAHELKDGTIEYNLDSYVDEIIKKLDTYLIETNLENDINALQ